MKKLPSEQIANDGGYRLPELINEANKHLKQIGKHGKRATIKVTPKPNKPISAQFSLNGKQVQKGLNLQLNKTNLAQAIEFCTLITAQLVANTYTDEWLESLLGKNKLEKEKILTCREMLEAYKKHYFKQREKNKSPHSTWLASYRHIEKVMNIYADRPISLSIIRQIVDSTENNTPNRTYHLDGLVNLLSYFQNQKFKEVIKKDKKENKPKAKKKYIPSDREIDYIYQYGFQPSKYTSKKYLYRYSQWQFLYSLLAIYGLRMHEAWNIANWDKPVILKNGDWVALSDDNDTENEDENGEFYYHQIKQETIIPAILNPNNQDYLLCIGHNTKTGYRVAFPLCPDGHTNNCQWIKKFNLIQSLNLPDIDNPLQRSNQGSLNCSHKSSHWFRRHKYGFTPHALRHAYNIRGHKLNINQKVLADGLGHGLIMNSSTYLKHEGYESKMQGLKKEITIDNTNRNNIEKLKAENEQLKAENERLKAENERLRTELKMYEILKKDR